MASARGLFINRNYTLFMLGSFVSATGSWIQSVALGWLAFDLGNSAFLLGLVSFARMIPLLVISFPAGALGDRFDRRRMIMFSQYGSTATAVVLAISVWLGAASIPLLVGLALVAGVFDAFAWPVWSVFIKDLVGSERLRTAVAVNSTRFNLTRIIGPSVGGVLLAAYGPALCFAVAAFSTVGVTAALLLIRLPPYPKREPTPWLPALAEGLRYASSEREVRRLLIVTAGLGFFALPYQSMLPAVAREALGVGPEGLGFLMTAVGLGAIVGAVLTGARSIQRNADRLVVWLPVGVGASLVMLGLAPFAGGMVTATVALALVGLCSIAYMSLANASLQLSTREDIVGRVMGLWTVVQAGVMPLGSLSLGGAGDLIGLPTTLVLAGVGAAAVAVVFRRPRGGSPAPERDERGADAEEEQGGHKVGRPLEVGRPAGHADRGLQETR